MESTLASFEREYRPFLAFSVMLSYFSETKISLLRISDKLSKLQNLKKTLNALHETIFVEEIATFCCPLRLVRFRFYQNANFFYHNFTNDEDILAKFAADLLTLF